MPQTNDLLDHRVSILEESTTEMITVMRGIETSLAKLVIIDDRQVQAALALDRLAARQDKLDDRVKELEMAGVNQKRTSTIVDRVLWAVASAALMFMANHVGLIK